MMFFSGEENLLNFFSTKIIARLDCKQKWALFKKNEGDNGAEQLLLVLIESYMVIEYKLITYTFPICF